VSGFAATIQNAFASDPVLILRLIVTAFCFYVLYEVYVYVSGRGRQYLGVVNLIERGVELLLSGIGKVLVPGIALHDDDDRPVRETVRRNRGRRDS
jgi:hypothetical protein